MAPAALELTTILNETEEEVERRETSQFDDACGSPEKPLVIFGAGNLGRKVLRGLRLAGDEAAAFADNNAALWGKAVEGLPVLPPEEAAQRYGQTGSFLVSIWNPQGGIRNAGGQLGRLGCLRVLPFVWLFWKYPSIFLPYYLWDSPHNIVRDSGPIRRAYDLFSDPESKGLFLSHLSLRLTGDFSVVPHPTASVQYFPSQLFGPSETEVFVDCGAYNGDTIRAFLNWNGGHFQRAIAIEPDPLNFAVLLSCLEELKASARIAAMDCATGASNGPVRFEASGSEAAAVRGQGSLEVRQATLDQVLADDRPTFIKMDVEGAEVDTLEGGRNVVQRDEPLMAVCVYHRQAHLWRIPLLIQELQPYSKLFLRQHAADGLDLVCYSVPRCRLL